jgi:hypothetical protein
MTAGEGGPGPMPGRDRGPPGADAPEPGSPRAREIPASRGRGYWSAGSADARFRSDSTRAAT